MLFKKATVFTDLHFGKKNNERRFNVDCEEFVKWFIEESKNFGAEICIFLGDWHDNRKFINVSTLNFSNTSLQLLNESFDQVFLIIGNHDLFYREKREIHSIEFAKNLKNIKVINDIEIIDDCSFVPWLMKDEVQQVKKIESKFMFGHLEIATFIPNSKAVANDEALLKIDDLQNNDFVFTGHFHSRQIKKNIYYIGNAFPHNFSDNFDTKRGMMFLESNGNFSFKSWPNQPKYFSFEISKLDEYKNLIDENSYVRILLDINLNYEESIKFREAFMEIFKVRDISLTPFRKEIVENSSDAFKNFNKIKSVDEIVIESLKILEKDDDPDLLIEIYNSLEITEE